MDWNNLLYVIAASCLPTSITLITHYSKTNLTKKTLAYRKTEMFQEKQLDALIHLAEKLNFFMAESANIGFHCKHENNVDYEADYYRKFITLYNNTINYSNSKLFFVNGIKNLDEQYDELIDTMSELIDILDDDSMINKYQIFNKKHNALIVSLEIFNLTITEYYNKVSF